MEQSFVDIINQHGYWALYLLLVIGIVGLPIPDETLMTFVGSLTAVDGLLSYTGTLIVSYCGAMTGMLISYTLGYKVGQPFLYRYGKWIMLTPERLAKAEGWFHKYGLWTVFFGYFIPGLRQLTCYWAGVSRVTFWRYLIYAGGGAVIWVCTFVTLGHFIGNNIEPIMQLIHHYLGLFVVIVLVIGLIAGLLYWKKRKRNSVNT